MTAELKRSFLGALSLTRNIPSVVRNTMSKSTAKPDAPTKAEAIRLLTDTAHAVRVMKASWLRVALNLKKIRTHGLWRYVAGACESYEQYVLEVLKLNKYVANRMLQAMEYTEEHRPGLIDEFRRGGGDIDIPSYEVVNQLRRVQHAFQGRDGELDGLRSRVFDDGVGRVVLKREIDECIGEYGSDDDGPDESSTPGTLRDVLHDLMEIEGRLLELKVPKTVQKLAFQLIEAVQKELKSRSDEDAEE